MDINDIFGTIPGEDLFTDLWPSSFKFVNFEYDISAADRLNTRRLILADLQIAYGFLIMGYKPPIDAFEGITKCIIALTLIANIEYKEENDV